MQNNLFTLMKYLLLSFTWQIEFWASVSARINPTDVSLSETLKVYKPVLKLSCHSDARGKQNRIRYGRRQTITYTLNSETGFHA